MTRFSWVPDRLIGLHQRRVFNQALRELIADPWACLDRNCDLTGRLIHGWANTDWSAQKEYLTAIVDEFVKTDGPVLECGSGLSTLILAVIADATGRRVYSLEHSSEWAAKVSRILERHKLESVKLFVGPLRDYGAFSWYDPPLDSIKGKISLVVCDGPPGSSRGGRYGMMPVMQDYLAEDVVILLDDTIRLDEKEIAERWSEQLDASVEYLGVDKQFAVIRAPSPKTGDAAQMPLEQGIEVTVGIPAFNSEDTIGQSIDSILSQSYRNIRLLVSDNCSQDETKKVCLDRMRKDRRVCYLRQKKNIGVFNNYNELFLKCRSKYFKWQSSSDWCESNVIEDCLAILESNPDVVLACPTVMLVDENGNTEAYREDFGLEMDDPGERFRVLVEDIRLSNVFNGLIRASAMEKTRLNRPFRGSDVVLLAELALQGKFVLIKRPMWYRRMTPATASKLQNVEQRAAFFSGSPRNNDKYVTWKLMYSLFEIVIRSKIGSAAKFRCLLFLFRRLFWIRGVLWREAVPTLWRQKSSD